MGESKAKMYAQHTSDVLDKLQEAVDGRPSVSALMALELFTKSLRKRMNPMNVAAVDIKVEAGWEEYDEFFDEIWGIEAPCENEKCASHKEGKCNDYRGSEGCKSKK